MDDEQLNELVELVRAAFPDDADLQRRSWEFLEKVLDEWDRVESASEVEPAGRLNALLGAVREFGARLVSDLVDVLEPAPSLGVLAEASGSTALHLAASEAEALGLEPTIVVENGADFVTVIARKTDDDATARPALLALTGTDVVVYDFRPVEGRTVAVHIEFPPGAAPTLAVVALES